MIALRVLRNTLTRVGRVNYDAALIGLARLTMSPDATWSSARPVVAPAFQNPGANAER